MLDIMLPTILFVLAFSAYFKLLIDCPLLPGIDGPYYVVQVVHIMKTGSLKYPDPPLTFYIMYIFTLLCGDVFLGVKLAVSVLTALSLIPLFFVVTYVTNSRSIAALSSIVYSLSFYILRMMSDFMKNSIGLLWLNTGLLTLVCFMNRRLSKRQFVITYLAVLFLTGVTHILDFWTLIAYSIVIAVLWLFLTSDKERSEFMIKAILTTQVTILTIFFVCATTLTGGDIFKVLSFISDLATSMTPIEARGKLPLSTRVLVPVITAIAAPFTCLINKKNKIESTMALSSATMTFLLNLLPLPFSWIMRLNLMSCIPLAIMMGILVNIVAKSTEHVIAASLILIPSLTLISVIDSFKPRPSIPPPAYEELKEIILRMNDERTVWLVPDTRIRYWVETIIDNVIANPKALLWHRYKILILVYKLPHIKPIKARLVYSGMFFNIYRLR